MRMCCMCVHTCSRVAWVEAGPRRSRTFWDCCTPTFFLYADCVHTLTCAIMLLNTDLHGQVRMQVGGGDQRLGWELVYSAEGC